MWTCKEGHVESKSLRDKESNIKKSVGEVFEKGISLENSEKIRE